MAAADFVLPGEPCLVVVRPAGIEDPLAEALAHRVEIGPDRLMRLRIAEIGEEVRRAADEPVPDVENGFDLILDDAVRLAQRGDVFVSEEQGCLECREIVFGER